MAEEYVLQMCNISKSFGGTYACSNVNFNVSPGTVHALLGENGAGKSTLMKVLGGVHAADSGEIYISGQKVKIDSVQKSIASGVAMIHQELSQIPKLSVAENFCVGSEPVLQHFPLVIDKKKMIKTASDVFRRLGLNIDPTMRMGDLSIAEMQMVEIAKAVSRNAKIVIMDEPTSAITDREVEKLFEIIESLKRQGTAIIYISHKMDEVFRISDMISVMRDGHMIGTQKACDLTEEKLVPMLVGREITDYYSHESTTPGDVILEVRNLSRKGKFEDISMLKITRLDTGNIIFEKKSCRVSELIAHSVNDLTTRAKSESKQIQIDGDGEQQLICDMEWTGEAIGNIVKNALDHTQAGGIVRITWERTPAMFRIFISDNGNGIVPEDIYHIFKRFYRSKHSLDTQGIGLGLPLAKSIIEGQNGVISVQSEVGKGTLFTLSFLTDL